MIKFAVGMKLLLKKSHKYIGDDTEHLYELEVLKVSPDNKYIYVVDPKISNSEKWCSTEKLDIVTILTPGFD